jgi:hypothetical protein
MSDSETSFLKCELGISNDLASLLYPVLVSGDNNFICRLSVRQMTWHLIISKIIQPLKINEQVNK